MTNTNSYSTCVTSMGAVGDGQSDDARAIQRALDEGGLVTIPFGIFRIGRPLRLKSGARLRVHPRAHLIFADGAGTDSEAFLVTNADKKRGNADIRIEGGIWDGNNPGNPRGPDSPGSYTGVLIDFTNVEGLDLSGMVLRNAESYNLRLCAVRRFRVEDIRFEATHIRPNQDGVHLGGHCEDGLIRGIRANGLATPNDDMVAINADDAPERAQNLGKPCGPIRRLRVEDIEAADCHSFVRMASVWSAIEDVAVDGVRGGCRVCALNADATRECRVPLVGPRDADTPDGVGMLRRVVLRSLDVHRSWAGSHKPLIDIQNRMEDFRIERLRRAYDRDADPLKSTLRIVQAAVERLALEGLTEAQAGAVRAAEGVEMAVMPMTDPAVLGLYAAAGRVPAEAGLYVDGDIRFMEVG